MAPDAFFRPDWQVPDKIKSFCTTRHGGVSRGQYATLNLASHVGDERKHIESNRRQLVEHLNLPGEPLWLEQIHGHRIVQIGERTEVVNTPADAAYTRVPGKVLTVMIADCLPVLLASADASEVAAVHAGWKGMAAGIIGEACSKFNHKKGLVAWLGPAIGPCHYEVGSEVRDAFSVRERVFFKAGKDEDHWWMDLYGLARLQLSDRGVDAIYGGGFCTYHQQQFYSYRRDVSTGRFAVFIWIENQTGD